MEADSIHKNGTTISAVMIINQVYRQILPISRFFDADFVFMRFSLLSLFFILRFPAELDNRYDQYQHEQNHCHRAGISEIPFLESLLVNVVNKRSEEHTSELKSRI